MKKRSINRHRNLKTPLKESHNDAGDESLKALVRFLARMEAEKDFRLYLGSLDFPKLNEDGFER